MALCHGMAVARNADVVLVEFSINDGSATSLSMDMKRVQERLIRKVRAHVTCI